MQEYEALFQTRVVGKKAIRKAFQADYERYGTYDLVGDAWCVSNGVAWSMVNKKNYWPKDKKIEVQIFKMASLRGIPLGNRGGRDLFSMPTAELLWRLENREEI